MMRKQTCFLFSSVIFPLSILLGWFCLISPKVWAAQSATITVNTLDDELNADGDCSLREALVAANHDSGVDNCVTGNGIDTILIPSGSYTLTIPGVNEEAAATGDLDITASVIISGTGSATTVIDCNRIDTVFEINSQRDSNIVVTIAGLHIRNGDGLNAGGINNHLASLTIRDSTISMSEGWISGGLYNNAGVITITNSMISDNLGRGVNNSQGKVYIFSSTISGNRSYDGGGGVNNRDDGDVIIVDSMISKNEAYGVDGEGGGIQNIGVITIVNSTISDNQASGTNGRGGGITNRPFGHRLYLINSTVSDNHAGNYAGGVFNRGTFSALNSTIASNSAERSEEFAAGFVNYNGEAIFKNALIVHNNTWDCHKIYGTLSANEYNLDSDGTCDLASSASEPLVGTLQDQGGPTLTHPLMFGSPAIDAADSSLCPETDQRGVTRPLDGDNDGMFLCDIGAFEFDSGLWTTSYFPIALKE